MDGRRVGHALWQPQDVGAGLRVETVFTEELRPAVPLSWVSLDPRPTNGDTPTPEAPRQGEPGPCPADPPAV